MSHLLRTTDSCLVHGAPYNTRELVDRCPTGFKDPKNKWFAYARNLYYLVEYHDVAKLSDGWKYKLTTPIARKQQLELLFSLLHTQARKSQEDNIIAVVAWSLSKILITVPDTPVLTN